MKHLFDQLANPNEALTDDLRVRALAQREDLLASLAELLVSEHRPKQIRAIEVDEKRAPCGAPSSYRNETGCF